MHNYITMHGAKNVKFTLNNWSRTSDKGRFNNTRVMRRATSIWS